jgi:hypothetical protein
MSRAVVTTILIAVVALFPAQATAAQTAQGCQAGEAPHFLFGFADLKMQVGAAMGEPVTCEFSDPNGTGDVHQRTTTGLAFWRKSTNTPTFTNGFDHWANTPGGWVTWTGASVDPPATAGAPAATTASGGTPYPDVVVQGFRMGCEGQNADIGRRAACGCAIGKIQATYSLADFLNLSAQIVQQGSLPQDLTSIVLQCVLEQLTG